MKTSLWPEVVAAAFVALSGFVELHIWSPAYTYFLLMLLVVLDVSTAVLLRQRRYRQRVLLILPAYTLVLAFAHGFGKNEPGLVWLPQAVVVLMVVIHLRRLIRNFGQLDLLDTDMATLMDARLKKRLDEPAAALEQTLLPAPCDEAVPA